MMPPPKKKLFVIFEVQLQGSKVKKCGYIANFYDTVIWSTKTLSDEMTFLCHTKQFCQLDVSLVSQLTQFQEKVFVRFQTEF